MMEIFRILDELEMMIKESKKMPFSNGKAVIESHRFLDRLDRIRAILPEELETAKILIDQKDKIVNEACAEAEKYVEQSKDKAARMVDDNEITRNAMSVAEEIVGKAEQVSMEIRRDANEYAEGVLSHMEIVLRKGLEAVTQGKDELREALRNNDV
ncbi:MAG TPA: ATPase [Syntrophomonadaceae bacterium]|nr:ATPase [Syntrophomonadaceae bacterium]